ncbi:MAG: hypothetical protein KQH63_22160 [Desulfobulbaceae bacterium]|nr:hypothetical protein [Desulfobulbaceae bacterium]
MEEPPCLRAQAVFFVRHGGQTQPAARRRYVYQRGGGNLNRRAVLVAAGFEGAIGHE